MGIALLLDLDFLDFELLQAALEHFKFVTEWLHKVCLGEGEFGNGFLLMF